MTKLAAIAVLLCLLTVPLVGQDKRLWVLRNHEMTEYDLATLSPKQTVKLPPEVAASPSSLSVNRKGQMLFAPLAALPVAEGDWSALKRVWLWNGSSGSWIERAVDRKVSSAGSNTAITESAAQPFLSSSGGLMFWYSNEARRLQRDGVDLSTNAQWMAWRTDLTGKDRQEIARTTFKECRCLTGSCEETCAHGEAWVPEEGMDHDFLYTEFITGQTQLTYQSSSHYTEEAGSWTSSALVSPLRRILDASGDGRAVIEAVPDIGCCGWANESNDQTILRLPGRTVTVFDEHASFSNADYDVSFFSSNAKLSPSLSAVAMTITATAQANQPIQLADQGQADPEQSRRIRKALTELPAVEIKTVAEQVKQIAYLPHAMMVGWISEKEVLVVEEHQLVVYGVGSGSRRKSSIHVEDAEHVFLR